MFSSEPIAVATSEFISVGWSDVRVTKTVKYYAFFWPDVRVANYGRR